MADARAKQGALALTPYVFMTAADRYRLDAELGRLLVPERRGDPHSKLIELAFVRFKSTAARPGPPIVMLAGGPGEPGIRSARQGLERVVSWFTALREAGDVILLDQRGVGRSNPALVSVQRWDLPLDRPGSREELLRVGRERSRATAAYWRERGVDLAGYTTEESADDVDALRAALGEERISLWGGSYGSHLALATIRRHGPRIHRALIPMVEGPDHTIKLPSNVQRQMEHIAALVRADPRLSAAIPDFLGLVRDVLERLERDPVTASVPDRRSGNQVRVTLGRFDLQLVTAGVLGNLDDIRRLPARYHAMSRGDFSWAAGAVLEWRIGWFGSAMSYHMDCASGLSQERYERIQREAKETLLGDLIDFPFPYVCDAWGSPDLGPAFRAPVRSDVPVLFVSGTLDGRTPAGNADEVRQGFPNSRHLIVEGGAHGLVGLSPEVDRVMSSFLKGHDVTTPRIAVPFAFSLLEEDAPASR